MMDLAGWVFLVLFLLGMGAFVWTQIRNDRRRRAELDALAARRGWQVFRLREGRRQLTRVLPPDGAWELEIAAPMHRRARKTSSVIPGHTRMRCARPAWTQGRALIQRAGPGTALIGNDRVLGFLNSRPVQAMLSAALGPDMAEDLASLRPVPAPPGIALSIMASTPPQGLDHAALQRAIDDWHPARSRDGSPPSVRLGPEGMTLSLPHNLIETPDIERFVDHGTALAATLDGSMDDQNRRGTAHDSGAAT